jgi:hypothetical protein
MTGIQAPHPVARLVALDDRANDQSLLPNPTKQTTLPLDDPTPNSSNSALEGSRN